MSTSNERVSPDKQEDVPVVRHVSEVHIPSTSATRSTSANISHDESDVLSSYIRNVRGDVQSTIFTAYTLSRQAATRANEVAVAAYGKDLDGAEQKIAELQAASEAAMEAILRAAAQLDVVVPTSSGGVQDDEKDIGNAADLREGVGRDTRNEKAGNNEPEAMVPPDIADEQNRRKLIADAKRREKEAIAQAEAELEELGMDAKKSTSRTRFKENSTTRKMKQLTVTTEVRETPHKTLKYTRSCSRSRCGCLSHSLTMRCLCSLCAIILLSRHRYGLPLQPCREIYQATRAMSGRI